MVNPPVNNIIEDIFVTVATTDDLIRLNELGLIESEQPAPGLEVVVQSENAIYKMIAENPVGHMSDWIKLTKNSLASDSLNDPIQTAPTGVFIGKIWEQVGHRSIYEVRYVTDAPGKLVFCIDGVCTAQDLSETGSLAVTALLQMPYSSADITNPLYTSEIHNIQIYLTDDDYKIKQTETNYIKSLTCTTADREYHVCSSEVFDITGLHYLEEITLPSGLLNLETGFCPNLREIKVSYQSGTLWNPVQQPNYPNQELSNLSVKFKRLDLSNNPKLTNIRLYQAENLEEIIWPKSWFDENYQEQRGAVDIYIVKPKIKGKLDLSKMISPLSYMILNADELQEIHLPERVEGQWYTTYPYFVLSGKNITKCDLGSIPKMMPMISNMPRLKTLDITGIWEDCQTFRLSGQLDALESTNNIIGYENFRNRHTGMSHVSFADTTLKYIDASVFLNVPSMWSFTCSRNHEAETIDISYMSVKSLGEWTLYNCSSLKHLIAVDFDISKGSESQNVQFDLSGCVNYTVTSLFETLSKFKKKTDISAFNPFINLKGAALDDELSTSTTATINWLKYDGVTKLYKIWYDDPNHLGIAQLKHVDLVLTKGTLPYN